MMDINKLSKEKQKVIIAKDVLEQIAIGRYTPHQGKYIAWMELKDYESTWRVSDLDVKSNFGKIKNCTVCLIGACLLSTTKFKNELRFQDIDNFTVRRVGSKNANTQMDLLRTVFTNEELYLMECLFEGYNPGDIRATDGELTQEEDDMVNDFTRSNNADERIRKVMQHIIDNKGVISLTKLIEQK